jgi:predicted phage tail protein
MTKVTPHIVGGFGGGGSQQQTPRVPTVASDTLQSKAFARVLDAISEGEIEGLVDGDKSIFLDNTALQNSNGTYNFKSVTTHSRTGSQNQTLIEGFAGVESETPVGITVEAINAINGTWERESWDATFTKPASGGSVATITITATAHGLSNGESVFLNFADYDGIYDTSYTIANVTANTFTVTRVDTKFVKTSGQVYVLRKRLKINAVNSTTWLTNAVYITFLQQSSDTTRTFSTLWTKTGTYNGVFIPLFFPAPTSTYFYIEWTADLPGPIANVAVDGGSVVITTATYTRSSTTITVFADNHGLTAGMNVDLTFRNGPMGTKNGQITASTFSKTVNSTGLTTNQFTVTHPAGTNTGTGAYFVDTPVTAGAITRTLTNSEVDRVRVKIQVPTLQAVQSDGDVVGWQFRYAIDAQLPGGGYQQVISEIIKGKTSGGYTFDREITLRSLTGWDTVDIDQNFPLDIRVRRVSEDSTSARIQNAFNWQSYTEITDAKLRYPNTALVGIEIDSEQFSSVPQRSYLIKGVKVRIPSNATVDATTGRLNYAGLWDGTFAAATWCSCPAWILWDLLTNTRYGFGEQILTDAEKASFDGNASRLDKWSFYEASKYANELVNTGLSNPTQEARFACNVNIQNAQEAFTLVNELLSVFRCQAYWANGSITLTQDRSIDAAYLFGSSNVVNGDFSYSGSDIKTRPTVVLVKWFNLLTRDYSTEVVEDIELVNKYGVIKQEITAFACTSQSQAARVGRWLLYSNANETETVSFAIGIDSGVIVRPGMVIKINDQTRAAIRLSGRISAGSTTTTVVIDANCAVSAGDELSVVLPDGIVQTRTVSAYTSATRTITVSSAFDLAPNENGIWLLTTSAVNPTTWRVISVGEDAEQGVYGITALSYNPSKYDYVESGAPLESASISILGEPPAAPTNISISENMYADNNVVFVKVSIGWSRVTNATAYQVRYRISNGNWINLPITESSQVDIANAKEGTWEIQVYAISVNGKMSQPASDEYQVIGKTAVPTDVSDLRISQIDDKTAQLNWNLATDLDVLIGGKVIIRHSTSTTSPEWYQGTNIIDSLSGNQSSAQVPLLTGTYMARFMDSTGNTSLNVTSVQVVLPDPKNSAPVITFNEHATSPPFQGNLTNMFYSAEQDGLVLGQELSFDNLALDGDFDDLVSIDAAGDIVPSGQYEFASTLSMDTQGAAGVFDVDMIAQMVTRGFLPGSLWDDKIEVIDTWFDIDGSQINNVDAKLYVRSTNDDPAGTDPVYTAWEPIVNGSRRGRGFQFKVIATSNDVTENIIVEELGATVTMPRRQETGQDVISGASAYSVTFANAFFERPSIGIAAQNMATGDYYALSSVSRTGFTVTFRNASGTAISRTFDWQAIGYGKQIT